MNAIEIYIEHLKRICPDFTDLEMTKFSQGLTVSKFKRNEILISAGSIQKKGGFIAAGLIRAFHLDDVGNERNVYFKAENEYSFHYTSYMNQQPCPLSFQCLEPSIIVNFPIGHIDKAYLITPTFEKYGRIMTEHRLKDQQDRLESFLFGNAEQRYIDFTRQHANLFNRISISQLCSYLGVERQTLTRIRQKISKGD